MPACRRAFASFEKIRWPCGRFSESLALALAVYADLIGTSWYKQIFSFASYLWSLV